VQVGGSGSLVGSQFGIDKLNIRSRSLPNFTPGRGSERK
jgi:hypothetical protein